MPRSRFDPCVFPAMAVSQAPIRGFATLDCREGQVSDALKFTADIVAAHVSNNDVARDELPQLIQSVHDVLARAGREPEKPAKPTPAVSVRSSVTKVALICLECGKKQKTLKRHLKTGHGLTPDEYRERYSLKSSYPMVAPAYSAERSEMAKKIGLGTKGQGRRKAKKKRS